MSSLRDLLADPTRVSTLTPSEAATALVELASLQAAVAARLHSAPEGNSHRSEATPDRLLTAEDVAERLGRTRDWVYRQSKHWPFTRKVASRTVRFSELGLQRFLAQRRSFTPEGRKVSSGG